MGTNNVRYYREKAGMTVKELSSRMNLHVNSILQVERAESSWGHTPWGYDCDKRFADALGVKLADLFSDYRPPEKPKEPQPKPSTRTPEQVDEDIRIMNEQRQTKIVGEREIYDTMDYTEEWCPGVVRGPGARKHDFQKKQRGGER